MKLTPRWSLAEIEAFEERAMAARDQYRCQRCKVMLTSGRSDPRSAIVHHKQSHKGDLTLFYDTDNLEAVCWSCHSSAIQIAEALGYNRQVSDDGWPIDPKHPSVS